jgi:hypothetical protein
MRQWRQVKRRIMPPKTTRTLNPLPFDALEPKRFEDLVRQLAYDFLQWRMLEATGRSGSDDGYDARGYEVSSETAVEAESEGEEEVPAATAAAIWREGRPFVGWPGASRLFGGRCRAG